MRNSCFRLTALALIGLAPSGLAHAQTGDTDSRSPNHFPYLFSNFPWWSDAALRVDLKKRIPGLGDELVEDSRMEARVRTVLSQLLNEKGIHAQVTTEEPSEDLLSAPRGTSYIDYL